MSNATLYKYTRLYSVNRHFNDEFDKWIETNFSVTVGRDVWNYGEETFRDETGRIYLDAHVMQGYVRSGGQFYATDDDWWDKKLSKGVRNVPKF